MRTAKQLSITIMGLRAFMPALSDYHQNHGGTRPAEDQIPGSLDTGRANYRKKLQQPTESVITEVAQDHAESADLAAFNELIRVALEQLHADSVARYRLVGIYCVVG